MSLEDATLLGGGEAASALLHKPLPPTRNAAAKRKLWISLILCTLLMLGEGIGGALSGSLAIFTDAAHMLADVIALAISLAAIYMSERPPSASHTFGYARMEVLGAMASMALVAIMVTALVFEAVQRVLHPEEVDGLVMFITATLGLVMNVALLLTLGHSHGGGEGHSHGGHSHGGDSGHSHGGHSQGGGGGHSHGGHSHGDSGSSLAVTAAFIHVVGDLIQSIGVMIAAIIIWVKPAWHLADPITTFVFSILVLFSTFTVVKTSLGVLMNASPPGVDVIGLLQDLQHIPGVSNVHDLHVWGLSPNVSIMTVHVVADDATAALKQALAVAKEHKIAHPTVQVERCGTEDVQLCAASGTPCELKVDLSEADATKLRERCRSGRSGSGGAQGHHSCLPPACADCGQVHVTVAPPRVADVHVEGCGGIIRSSDPGHIDASHGHSHGQGHSHGSYGSTGHSPTLQMRSMAGDGAGGGTT